MFYQARSQHTVIFFHPDTFYCGWQNINSDATITAEIDLAHTVHSRMPGTQQTGELPGGSTCKLEPGLPFYNLLLRLYETLLTAVVVLVVDDV